jgi:D-sedoheptulose 7-phosphate isomerase
MKYKKYLLHKITQHCEVINSLEKQDKNINNIIKIIMKKLNAGGKLLLCGNGGSAADAQHLAAEFLIRLRPTINRIPIPAMTLSMDTSTLTACGNDYKFEDIFSRPFEALCKKNDLLIVISTSGNSANIIKVLSKAKKKGVKTIGFLGNKGGKAKSLCDFKLIVESTNTAIIQEAHIFLGHYIFEKVEDLILKKS